MSAAESKPARAKVRKIFKKGDIYLCGLCGKNYPSIPEAQFCLSRCTQDYLRETGTVEAPQKRYRCSFCKRIHPSIEEAQACSETCKRSLEQKAMAERKVAQTMSVEEKLKALAQFAKDPAAAEALKTAEAQAAAAAPAKVYRPKKNEILAGENIKFQRDKHMFRCLRCKQRYSSPDDARQCWDSHGEGGVLSFGKPKSNDPRYELDGKKFRCKKCERLYVAVDDAIRCHDSHTAPVGKSGKEEVSEAYFRDGAKYVCRKCNKKYFTRSEAETCFNSVHPEGELQAAAPEAGADAAQPAAPTKKEKDADLEKFFRDGAKYVCRGCSKKYFSKTEVVECFDKDAAAAPSEPTS